MKKALLILILLALIPTFSMANVDKKTGKNGIKNREKVTTELSKPKEYSENEVIIEEDMTTAYTLDGKKLTGIVVLAREGSSLSKVTTSYKDGKVDGEQLFYDSDNHVMLSKEFKNGKLLNFKAYYQNGKTKDSIQFEPYLSVWGYYPNGKMYVRAQKVNDLKNNSQHLLTRIYNFQGELVAQISTKGKEPYAKCILPGGTIKNMTHLNTDHKYEFDEDGRDTETKGDVLSEVVKYLSDGDRISLMGALDILTDKVKDGQEFKCEYE